MAQVEECIAAALARLGAVATDAPAYARRGGGPPCRLGSSERAPPRSFGGSTLPPPMPPTSRPAFVPKEPPVPKGPPPLLRGQVLPDAFVCRCRQGPVTLDAEVLPRRVLGAAVAARLGIIRHRCTPPGFGLALRTRIVVRRSTTRASALAVQARLPLRGVRTRDSLSEGEGFRVGSSGGVTDTVANCEPASVMRTLSPWLVT